MSISMIQRYLPVPQSNLFYCTALHALIAMKGKPAAKPHLIPPMAKAQRINHDTN